ncbi:hypothetical protein [Rothia sp. 88186D007BW]
MELIPTGTTYHMVAGAGFEPAASGLQDPIYSQVLKTTFLLKKLYAIGALKVEGQ